MKRIVSLVLALSMVLGLCGTAFAANLSDVENTKYAAAVEALVELEVVAGYPDGTYKPEKEVNRAELAKMIVISMGLEEDAERAQGDNIFTDESLKEGEAFAWARGYVNTAAAAGVIKGYPTGDFKPEKTVTYAESLTMMLRALGYGNVMEEEGTWPTNAILKARELELTDDVKYANSSDGAVRGDIAILLWNMLRTPMWKITSENQGTGMTSQASKKMLNVKFPDYMYDDEAKLDSFEIEDGEVTVTLVYDDEDAEDVVGTLTSGDLLRLVEGMKVSYLYNIEEEEFLTITPVDTLVEGRVDENGKVNGKEYKDMEAVEGEYVVLLTEGKKVVTEEVLPEEAYEIGRGTNSLKKVKKSIGEDALVIIDGEWLTAEDLEEGDIVTEVTPDDNAANVGDEGFYVVARERVTGEFESFTRDEDAEEERFFFEVDGEEYEAVADDVTVYEYNEDEEDYEEATEAFDEFADKKGKYFGEEVELALDYLGNVINIYFGEVKDTEDADVSFYVLTGKNTWFESAKEGTKVYATFTGVEGEDDYEMEDPASVPEYDYDLYAQLSANYSEQGGWNDEALAADLLDLVTPAFINDDDKLEIVDEESTDFTDEFTWFEVANTTEDIINDNNYILDEDTEVDPTVKVSASTKVFTIRAVIEDDEVVGIEVEVTEGTEALEGVKAGKVAVAMKDGEASVRASYVFVAEDAKSTELNFGLVERYTDRSGINYVTISGERYEIDEENELLPEIGSFVSFRNTDGVVEMVEEIKVTDITDDKNLIVEDIEDEFVYFFENAEFISAAETTFGVDFEPLDVETKETKEAFEDYTFILGSASLNGDDEVEFSDDVEVLGEGIENVSFKKGDRLLLGKKDTVVAIIRGLSEEDEINAGVLVIEEEVEEGGEDGE